MSTTLRKKLLYRSTHRGCKETDILIGDFAQNCLDHLSDEQLAAFTDIIDTKDSLLYNIITGREKIPNNLDQQLMQQIIDFNFNKNQ